jgi:hypothetical protein
MKTNLSCIPCFARQALDAARAVSADPAFHERVLREVLRWVANMDLDRPPPAMAQRLHRRLRELTGVADPYRSAKAAHGRLALALLPELQAALRTAADPLELAVRIAIAGNVIDLGATGPVTESALRGALHEAIRLPFVGDLDGLRAAVAQTRRILYLADNAGEIVFDRLLVEQLPLDRVTLVVRGAPVLNDATREDARAAGLEPLVEVIDNGSDAPGTLLSDCSAAFLRRYAAADLILAKGQGNFESLSDERRDIFFLFRVKCPVVAERAGQPVGTQVLARRAV